MIPIVAAVIIFSCMRLILLSYFLRPASLPYETFNCKCLVKQIYLSKALQSTARIYIARSKLYTVWRSYLYNISLCHAFSLDFYAYVCLVTLGK